MEAKEDQKEAKEDQKEAKDEERNGQASPEPDYYDDELRLLSAAQVRLYALLRGFAQRIYEHSQCVELTVPPAQRELLLREELLDARLPQLQADFCEADREHCDLLYELRCLELMPARLRTRQHAGQLAGLKEQLRRCSRELSRLSRELLQLAAALPELRGAVRLNLSRLVGAEDSAWYVEGAHADGLLRLFSVHDNFQPLLLAGERGGRRRFLMKGQDPDSDEWTVLKGYMGDRELSMMRHTINTLHRIRHPFILPLLGVVCDIGARPEASPLWYLQFPLCEAGTLRDLLNNPPESWPSLRRRIFRNILLALAELHSKGIAHR